MSDLDNFLKRLDSLEEVMQKAGSEINERGVGRRAKTLDRLRGAGVDPFEYKDEVDGLIGGAERIIDHIRDIGGDPQKAAEALAEGVRDVGGDR